MHANDDIADRIAPRGSSVRVRQRRRRRGVVPAGRFTPPGVHAETLIAFSGAIELAIPQREFFGDAQELGDGVFRLSTDPAAGGPG